MANYQDFSLIKNEINAVKKREDLESDPMAFVYTFIEKLFPSADLETCITDGSGDRGIGAYYIDEENKEINFFQFKYGENFERVQKNTLSQREITNLITTINAIWKKDNKFLKDANFKIQEALREVYRIMDNGCKDANFYFVSNYFAPLSEKDQNIYKKKFRNDFRMNLYFYGIDDLIDLLITQRMPRIDAKIQVVGNNYFEKSAGNIRALVGEVNALNLLHSIVNEKDELKEGVFDENVRIYLKQTTDINKDIYKTATSESAYKFFYYNNGITAICDGFSYIPIDSPVVSFKNFQIVNGGQTIHALYDAYRNGFKDKLNNIYLLMRIYEVKDNRVIGQEIARYTNTQNPVRSRDIRANELLQIKIEEELKNFGFYYERKKNQYKDITDRGKRIDAEKAGQTILAFYLDLPGFAKNKKQEIFRSSYYDRIFDSGKINAEYLLLPYQLFLKVEEKIKTVKKEIKEIEERGDMEKLQKILDKNGFLLHAHYYILMTMKLLVESLGIDLEKKNVNKIFKQYDNAKEIIGKIVKIKQKDPKFSLPHLFKSDELVEDIKRAVNKLEVKSKKKN